ncbi:MAG: hypothetical protein EPO23_03435 [Xanthobacteraceae bacterium]|nr:MAG: hypothetical protein EPO23_03435 [Xanthobacteraceae bacterium]
MTSRRDSDGSPITPLSGLAAMLIPTIASPPLAPSAGIPGPLTEHTILAALCETYRAARAAGRGPDEAAEEAAEAGQRITRLLRAGEASP